VEPVKPRPRTRRDDHRLAPDSLAALGRSAFGANDTAIALRL